MPPGLRVSLLLAVLFSGPLLAGCVTPPPAAGPVDNRTRDPSDGEGGPPDRVGAVAGYATPDLFRRHTLHDRARAYFGDPEAPRALLEATEEDDTLFSEIATGWRNFSESARRQLERYVVRPDDPASIYAAPPEEGLSFDAMCTYRKWQSKAQGPVKVWWQMCDEHLADRALRAANKVWAEVTRAMGVPNLTDDGRGGGPEIDFYLVRCSSCVPSRNVYNPSYDTRNAGETRLDVGLEVTGSSFVLLGVATLLAAPPCEGGSAFERTVTHELFHVLQNRYDKESKAPLWLREGTAKAAELRFHPEYGTLVHDCMFPAHQGHNPSLTARGYDAYLWWRQAWLSEGDAGILRVWKEIGFGASPFAAADKGLRFKENFREHAFRNLNRPDLALTPAPRWWKDVETGFARTERIGVSDLELVPADGLIMPAGQGASTALRDLPNHIPGSLDPLSATYLRVVVDEYNYTHDGQTFYRANQVRIDPRGLGLDATLTLDVLWRTQGGDWRRDRVTERAVFCEALELILVLANADERPRPGVSFAVRALGTPCDCPDVSWVREWDFRAQSPPGEFRSYTLSARLGEDTQRGIADTESSIAAFNRRFPQQPLPSLSATGGNGITYGEWAGAVAPSSTFEEGTYRSDRAYGGLALRTQSHLCDARVEHPLGFGGAFAGSNHDEPRDLWGNFGPPASFRAAPPAGTVMEQYLAVTRLAGELRIEADMSDPLRWTLTPVGAHPDF